MSVSLNRRALCIALAGAPFLGACQFAGNRRQDFEVLNSQLHDLETAANGRLGLTAISTSDQTYVEYRAHERFPMSSTFKVMLVAAVLDHHMREPQLLQQRLTYESADLVTWSPVTQTRVESGMTVAELCAAAVQYSDNTAANLLMGMLGGPQAVTAYARRIGDKAFRLDRWETALNTAIPGDERDTTTPYAMARSLQALVLGDALGSIQRALLHSWLEGNTTGNASIRAGVPPGWVVGDKTGGGDYGTTNDVAILWPDRGGPIVLAVYFTQHEQNASPRKDVLASATQAVLNVTGWGAPE